MPRNNGFILKVKEYLLAQPNFSFVIPKLAIGGQTHNLSLYRRFGIRSILDVRSESHDNAEKLAKFGICLSSLHVPDNQAPTYNQLMWSTEWISGQLANGNSVCIHCKHGSGRSVVVVAAYLISRGVNCSKALETIKFSWKGFSPNTLQIDAIKAYERDYNSPINSVTNIVK